MKAGLMLRYECADDEVTAKDLESVLKECLPECGVTRAVRRPRPSAAGTRDAILTVAVITLILTIPPAVKNSLDLADRFKLKDRCERLIAWAKARRARRKVNPFAAVPPNGKLISLDQASPEQLLEAIAGPEAPSRPQP